MVTVQNLPDEILEFILTYLPPYRDLDECRLVCKRWQCIVKNVIRRSKMNLNKGLYDYRLSWHTLKQNEKQQPTIAGRFSHSAVVHNNSMYIFGGGSSTDTTFNDLWRFDLSHMKWVRPLSMGSYPSPKGSATMAYYREKLILFGGWRYPSLHPPYQPLCLFDELHFYDLQENRWIQPVSTAKPPPMAGHSATVHGHKMIVFGGYQVAGDSNFNSNETWCLDLQNFIWSKPKIIGNLKPPARFGQYQTKLNDNNLLIFGGCGGPNNSFTDAWILNMPSGENWQWKSIPVRNRKWSASPVWYNPICRIGSKLVVLGQTPNLPSDFQIMKHTHNNVERLQQQQQQQQVHQQLQHQFRNRFDHHRLDDVAGGGGGGPQVNRRRHMANNNNVNQNNNNLNNNINNNNARELIRNNPVNQNEAGLLNDRNRPSGSRTMPAPIAGPSSNGNQAAGSAADEAAINQNNANEDEAANRLQRNLALRCRENEPRLPKRFDEPYEDRFRMAAFNVQQSHPRSISRDHQERIRRLEEKMNAIRNSRRAQPVEEKVREPSPKRVKRNVVSMFVCDISNALSPTDPFLQWIEYKTDGIISGAPERFILSSAVAGNGELILFGGVHKETMNEITHKVSNDIHFLMAPTDIV